MTKKIFALIIGVFLILTTSCVFAANNEFSDSMNKSGNTIKNVVGGAENVIEGAGSAIGTGIRDLGNTFADGAARVTNNGNTRNNGYQTTRTATNPTTNNGTFLGMSSTTWTWFVLAIATIAIVGLVWYYAMQNKNEYNNNH